MNRTLLKRMPTRCWIYTVILAVALAALFTQI